MGELVVPRQFQAHAPQHVLLRTRDPFSRPIASEGFAGPMAAALIGVKARMPARTRPVSQ
jgi:hypothetical protein